jgi:antitoxin ParD1/3/4
MPIMPTRNVVLTSRQEELIDTLIEKGRYQNASEVLRDGLRLLEQREAEDATKLDALKQAAKRGMASVEAGEVRSFASTKVLERHLDQLAAKALGKTKR